MKLAKSFHCQFLYVKFYGTKPYSLVIALSLAAFKLQKHSQEVAQTLYSLQRLKYLLSGSLQKKFSDYLIK